MVLDLVSTALYLYAARRVLKVLPEDRAHSTEAFALFWFGVAIVNLLQAGLEGVALWRDPGVALALILLFFVPPLLAAVAYALTLRYAPNAAHRRRVRIMSASLAVYSAGLTGREAHRQNALADRVRQLV